jgi:hypothetical protein
LSEIHSQRADINRRRVKKNLVAAISPLEIHKERRVYSYDPARVMSGLNVSYFTLDMRNIALLGS